MMFYNILRLCITPLTKQSMQTVETCYTHQVTDAMYSKCCQHFLKLVLEGTLRTSVRLRIPWNKDGFKIGNRYKVCR